MLRHPSYAAMTLSVRHPRECGDPDVTPTWMSRLDSRLRGNDVESSQIECKCDATAGSRFRGDDGPSVRALRELPEILAAQLDEQHLAVGRHAELAIAGAGEVGAVAFLEEPRVGREPDVALAHAVAQ